MRCALLIAGLVLGCKKHQAPAPEPDRHESHDEDQRHDEHEEQQEQQEEHEEQEKDRDNFWRPQIVIVGQGSVKTLGAGFDCSSDGKHQRGECGPKLVRFKELQPPLLRATAAPHWRFDRWESLIREPSGATSPRNGPMPDGLMYLNGFGYSDTGELEIVKAVFLPE